MAHKLSTPFSHMAAALAALAFSVSAESADFAPIKTQTVGTDPRGLATGHLNGDTIPDLVSANNDDGNVSVLLGQAGNLGNFDAAVNYDVSSPANPSAGPFSLAIGDVKGSGGLADVVVAKWAADSGDADVVILEGNGDGTLNSPLPINPAPSPAFSDPRDVILGDVDNDGDLDIIVAEFGPAGTIRIFLKDNGSASYTEPANSPYAAGAFPFGMVFADATGEGIPDIVLANLDAGNTVTILEGTNNPGTFFTVSSTETTGATPIDVAVADLDGINGNDLAVANRDGNSVSILLSDGLGGFAAKVDTPVGSGPREIAIENISGDGNLDVIVTNQDSDNFTVLEGDGTGGFSANTNFAAGTAPSPLVVEDFDGDATVDVAVANIGAASTDISVLISDNPPDAVDDAFNVINGSGSVVLDVLDNDSDPDTGDTLLITAVGVGDQGGTITINGSSDAIDYTPVVSDATETFTYTIEDQFGYADTATVTVTIGANQAPSFTSSAVTAATQDSLYTYNITTTDPDTGDIRSITAPTLPTWLTLTDNGDGTASLSGTPTNSEVGDHSVNLVVTDNGGENASQPFTITVANVNDAPSFTSTPVTDATDDTAYVYNITATDPDAGDTLAITATTLPSWLTLTDNGDGTATLSGTPDDPDVGNHSVDLVVTDDGTGNLTDTQSFSIAVSDVNDPPSVVGSIPAQSGTEGTAFGPLDVSANFSDPDSTLSYSISGLPAGTGLSIDSGTAVISGTLTDADAQASPITVTVQATDGGGTPASQSFTLTVIDINVAPSFTSTPVTAATEDAAYTYNITSTDTDAPDTLAITATTLPSWLTLTDNGDGTATLSGTPLDADVGSHDVDLVVTDSGTGSLTDTQMFTITVTDVDNDPVGGGGGGGCAMRTTGGNTDPLMPLLLLAAVGALYRRRRQHSGTAAE